MTTVKHPRCCVCKILLQQTSGQRMMLNTEENVRNVKQVFDKDVFFGDTLCGNCRLIFYRKKADAAEEELSQRSSRAGSSQDAPFHVVDRPASPSVEVVEIEFPRVVSTHKYCFLCGSSNKIVTVPFQVRQQIFARKRIFIPKGNRCCPTHLIKNRMYEDELQHLRISSTRSSIEVSDLKHFLDELSIRSEMEIVDKVGDYTLSDERLKVFTGMNWENIRELTNMLTSLRNSQSRNVTQALVTFLFKLRTGNSNKVIAATLGLKREQQVSEYSDSVIKSFEKDVLPVHLGIHALSRGDLIAKETSRIARKLYNITTQLVLIFDGTYVSHEKSSNNEYQRRSYSGQKKKPLCKPFTIVTTNGYIVDTLGPFSANMNDAAIMEHILSDSNGIRSLMKPGDFCIVDRGFRDVADQLQAMGYLVKMPALKGNEYQILNEFVSLIFHFFSLLRPKGKRKQLTTSESNESRFVTKLRWVVEAIHGILGEKYHLLHQQLDNKLLPKIQTYCRIASFLNNKFGKRLDSDIELFDEMVTQMELRKCTENTLAKKVEAESLGRRKVPFRELSSDDIIDFPEMTEKELKIFFTGSYQLNQAISYLSEMMDTENKIQISCMKETENILKSEIRSRHTKAKSYKCFIEYQPNSTGPAGIERYCCDCANGNRTVGCCSHAAAVIYYLSHARYLSKIIRPAEILSKLFIAEGIPTVINEDSDED